jgi:hypothetical protein
VESIIAGLELGRWNVSDRAEQPTMIEPVYPAQRGEFDVLEAAPRTATSDQFRLVKAVDRLSEGVVVGVANAADRSGDARQSQTLGVPYTQILHPAIAMRHKILEIRSRGASSDPTPAKPPNEVAHGTEEAVEERGPAQGNANQQNALRTQSRIGAPSALDRVREIAAKDKNARGSPRFCIT